VTPVAPKEYQFATGSKSGLVVVSFTQPFSYLEWTYRGSNGGLFRPVDICSTRPACGYTEVLPGGTMVYALEVPAGEWDFVSWSEERQGIYHHSKEPFRVRFRSVAGRVTYAGNIQLSASGIATRDESARDVEAFLRQYKNVKPDQVDTHIMNLVNE